MELKKIHIKVRRERTFDWVHFCYVPGEIKENFEKYVNTAKLSTNHWIFKWAVEDFGNVKVNTWKDLEALKELIWAKYRHLYPKIFIESNTDNQGWIRAWYTEHMEKELKEVGK